MSTITFDQAVYTNRGCQPAKIIISVPHDGLWIHSFTGEFIERETGGADRHVTKIASSITTHCRSKGVAVDMIKSLLPRKLIDLNRPAPGSKYESKYKNNAFADERLRVYYQHYFDQLSKSTLAGINTYGEKDVLLLDLHGFTKNRHTKQTDDFDVILGTCHRSTILHGSPDRKIGSHLKKLGYKVFIPDTKNTFDNDDPFPGGHICHYLSKAHSINTIQMETESYFRSQRGEEDGKKLSEDISEWIIESYS